MADFSVDLYRQYWLRLLVRAGFVEEAKELAGMWGKEPTGIEPFQFDDENWHKLEQMQAVVEFYLNCNDPWHPREDQVLGGNKPLLPGRNDPDFKSAEDLKTGLHFVQIDCFGARNNSHKKSIIKGKSFKIISEKQVALSNDLDASTSNKLKGDIKSKEKSYKIYFPSDTKRASRSYSVINLDQNTLELDNTPDVPTGKEKAWEIIESSAWLSGKSAVVAGTTIQLGATVDLRGIKSVGSTLEINGKLYPIRQIEVEKLQITIVGSLPETPIFSWKISQEKEFLKGNKAEAVKLTSKKRKKNKTTTVRLDVSEAQKRVFKEIEYKDSVIFNPGATDKNSPYIILSKSDNLTIEVQGSPDLVQSIEWKIETTKKELQGTSATVLNSTVIELDGKNLDFDTINRGIDTMYLQSDQHKPSRTYRIVSVNKNNNTVTLDGTPDLINGNTAWHIPAGIGGISPPLEYNFKKTWKGPYSSTMNYKVKKKEVKVKIIDKKTMKLATGFDHYDGMLFVIFKGEVRDRFRFTSYTSQNYYESIRGNQCYAFKTWTAGGEPGVKWQAYPPKIANPKGIHYQYMVVGHKAWVDEDYRLKEVNGKKIEKWVEEGSYEVTKWINYAFVLGTDDDEESKTRGTDGPGDRSRDYWLAPYHNILNGDAYNELVEHRGMKSVFLHHGFVSNYSSGSAGCNVSPNFRSFRNFVINLCKDPLVPEEYRSDVATIAGISTNHFKDPAYRTAWDKSNIKGKYWLVRPDELPLGYPYLDKCFLLPGGTNELPSHTDHPIANKQAK